MKDLKIETEIARNLSKYWYEKAKEKAFNIELGYLSVYEEDECIKLSDLASILDQLPEPRIEEIEIGINENGEVFEVEPEKQPDITAAELVEKLVNWYQSFAALRKREPSPMSVINKAEFLLQKRKELK